VVRALRKKLVDMPVFASTTAFIRAHRRLFTTAVTVACIAIWTAVGASAWLLRDVVIGLPDEAALRDIGAMAQSTTLLDVHDRPAFTIYREQRIEVPLSRISPHLIDAILAVEDQRFYDHGGLDIVRVFGAALTNIREGRTAQGGSTLTQQLARQSFLTPEKTYRRKLKEAIVAARIEGQFEKDEILELYLNKVYFGDGLYGVEAASLGYFGKHAEHVSVAEAALLAGLVKSPSTYAPTVDLDRAVARREVVLEAMRDMGVIDRDAYRQALAEPVTLNDTLRKEEAYGRYFKEEVRKQLVERFGWERVYQGGMKVYTTLDLELQKAAEQEVARGLEEIERRRSRRAQNAAPEGDVLQGALVAMDPKTGEVRAMVGGRDFHQSKFNRATQAYRQPGSAFKPFVYAAAIERGFSPATVLTKLDEPTATLDGDWLPEDDHSQGSSMTMRTALRTSSNRAAVRMIKEVGIPAAVRYAERLGFGAVPGVPSLALGSGEVTLVSMVAAYSSFANEGMLPVPTLIRRVETLDGNVLYEGNAPPQRAVSEATAFLMSNMMADVITSGTAASARRFGFALPAAGKTGTTNDYHDAWFIGYTTTLATGVWVGYDMPRTIMKDGYAAQLAVPIWARFMKTATQSHKREWLKAPPTVTTATICRISGRLATSDCRSVASYDRDGYLSFQSAAYTEYFIRGTEPTTYCDQHDRYESYAWRAVGTSGSVTLQPSHDMPSPTPAQVAAPSGRTSDQTPPVSESAPTSPGARVEGRPADAAEPARKRPGFWGRLFGRR
jgi:penicillin-binding protein 1A